MRKFSLLIRAIYFIILVFYINPSVCQSILQTEWEKTSILSNGNDTEGWGVDVDADGNIYWPISANEFENGLDIICHKFDKEGTALWANPFFFGGAGTQHAYVCNAQSSQLLIGGRTCTGLVQTCDMLLVKVDKSTGEIVWNRSHSYGSDGYDEVDGLVVYEDEIYCGGWAYTEANGLFNNDIGLWKLDQNGNTLWSNSFGQNGSSEHQDGHIVVDNDAIYAAGLWNGHGFGNLYNGHSFLGKFSKSDGSFVDSTLFGFQSDKFLDIENALGMTSDGTYLYITGYTTVDDVNNWDIFIAKFDKSLNQIWYQTWGGEGTESARGIAVYDGRIFVAGESRSQSIVNNLVSDGILLQLDTDGAIIKYNTWGEEDNNSFRDIVVDENGIYISGTASSDMGDNQKLAFLIKSKNDITNTKNLNTQTNIEVIPNPAHGIIQIDFNNSMSHQWKLNCWNAMGYTIQFHLEKVEKNQVYIYVDYQGLIFIELNNDNERIITSVINMP